MDVVVVVKQTTVKRIFLTVCSLGCSTRIGTWYRHGSVKQSQISRNGRDNKMDRLDVVVVFLFIMVCVTWLFMDVLQVVKTPLSYFGITHWIPEAFLIYLIGYDISDFPKIDKKEREIIIITIFLFPLVYYTIIGKTLIHCAFGFGTGSLFSGLSSQD